MIRPRLVIGPRTCTFATSIARPRRPPTRLPARGGCRASSRRPSGPAPAGWPGGSPRTRRATRARSRSPCRGTPRRRRVRCGSPSRRSRRASARRSPRAAARKLGRRRLGTCSNRGCPAGTSRATMACRPGLRRPGAGGGVRGRGTRRARPNCARGRRDRSHRDVDPDRRSAERGGFAEHRVLEARRRICVHHRVHAVRAVGTESGACRGRDGQQNTGSGQPPARAVYGHVGLPDRFNDRPIGRSQSAKATRAGS